MGLMAREGLHVFFYNYAVVVADNWYSNLALSVFYMI